MRKQQPPARRRVAASADPATVPELKADMHQDTSDGESTISDGHRNDAESSRIVVSPEAFDAIQRMIDAPSEPTPELRALMALRSLDEDGARPGGDGEPAPAAR